MGYYNFPHTRNYDTDLEYLIKQYLNLRKEVRNLIAKQTIVYADPLQWNITTQYAKNTIVINGYNAYLSKQPVPSGILITNNDYWLLIGDFIKEFEDLRANIAAANNGVDPYLEVARNKGDLLWWNDVLYQCIVDIPIDSKLEIGRNIKEITIEDYISTKQDKLFFDTVMDMKKAPLINGNECITLGYYSINDNGSALYKITDTIPGSYYETLENGLYAELILQDTLTPEMFGAKGDGISDDTAALKNIFEYAYANKKLVHLTKIYGVSELIDINSCVISDNQSKIIALTAMNNICRISRKKQLQMLSINITVDGNGLADNCISLYQPIHSQLNLSVQFFKKFGVDLGEVARGNDENTINIYYRGLDDGTSLAGAYLRGSDNNINELYGYNTNAAVYVRDTSPYKINTIHHWTDINSLKENGCVVYFDTDESWVSFDLPRLTIGHLYQDTIKYTFNQATNKYISFGTIFIDTIEYYNSDIVGYLLNNNVKSNGVLEININNIRTTKTNNTNIFTFPSIIENPQHIFVSLANPIIFTEGVYYNSYDNIPVNSVITIRDPGTNTVYLLETKSDSRLSIKQTRSSSNGTESRMRFAWSNFSEWA